MEGSVQASGTSVSRPSSGDRKQPASLHTLRKMSRSVSSRSVIVTVDPPTQLPSSPWNAVGTSPRKPTNSKKVQGTPQTASSSGPLTSAQIIKHPNSKEPPKDLPRIPQSAIHKSHVSKRRAAIYTGRLIALLLSLAFLAYCIYLVMQLITLIYHPTILVTQSVDSTFRAPVISACSFQSTSGIPLEYAYMKVLYPQVEGPPNHYFYFNFGPGYCKAVLDNVYPQMNGGNNITGDRNGTAIFARYSGSQYYAGTFYWLQPSNAAPVSCSNRAPIVPPESWCAVYFPHQLTNSADTTIGQELLLQPHVSLDFSLSFGGSNLSRSNADASSQAPKVIHWQFNDYPTLRGDKAAQGSFLADLQKSIDLSTDGAANVFSGTEQDLYTAQGHGFQKLVVGNSTHVLTLSKTEETTARKWYRILVGANDKHTYYSMTSLSTLSQVEAPLANVDAATIQMSLFRDSNEITKLYESSPLFDIVSKMGGAWVWIPLSYSLLAKLFSWFGMSFGEKDVVSILRGVGRRLWHCLLARGCKKNPDIESAPKVCNWDCLERDG